MIPVTGGGGASGPFDYYPTTGAAIRAAAGDTRGRLSAVDQIKSSVQSDQRRLLQQVEGDLQGPASDAPQTALKRADDVRSKAVFAAGALELFAGAVDAFNYYSPAPRSVQKLNAAYWTAHANDFGVDAAEYPQDADQGELDRIHQQHQHDVHAARQAMMSTLQAEYGRLEADLDQHAADVSGMLKRGPNADDIKTMYGAGVLPDWVTVVWDHIDWKGAVTPPTDKGMGAVALWIGSQATQVSGAASDWATKYRYGGLRRPEYATRIRPGQMPRIERLSRWDSVRMRYSVPKAGSSAQFARWAKVGKAAGPVGAVLAGATGFMKQWRQDADRADLDTTQKAARATTRGVLTGAGAWAGAVAGAEVGAFLGSFAGPVGTVVGGVLGGAIGGIIGSGIGDAVSDAVVDTVGDLAKDAEEFVDDAADAVGDFFGGIF